MDLVLLFLVLGVIGFWRINRVVSDADFNAADLEPWSHREELARLNSFLGLGLPVGLSLVVSAVVIAVTGAPFPVVYFLGWMAGFGFAACFLSLLGLVRRPPRLGYRPDGTAVASKTIWTNLVVLAIFASLFCGVRAVIAYADHVSDELGQSEPNAETQRAEERHGR